MYKNDGKFRYRYYSNNIDKVVAVSSYAGKKVRGVAKCNAEDTFDETLGKELATARCNLKIAEKRHKRAQSEYEKAAKAMYYTEKRFQEMCDYLKDAAKEEDEAKNVLSKVISKVN